MMNFCYLFQTKSNTKHRTQRFTHMSNNQTSPQISTSISTKDIEISQLHYTKTHKHMNKTKKHTQRRVACVFFLLSPPV
jgi:phosphoribosylanthranilate isomerase